MSREELHSLITLHQSRLQKLKERQAIQGITTDPADLFEIETIEATIASLQAELAALPGPSAPPETGTPSLTALQQQRLADLQRHLERDQQLLREYEDLLPLEDDPRRLMRYRKEIERQKAAIAGYKQELADILPDAATRAEATPDQIQQTLADLQAQITAMEERLAAGQESLSEQMNQHQRHLLDHIDARHRETLQRVTDRLEVDQIETVELLYNLVDRQQVAQWELDEITTLVQQALVKLKDAPNAAYWQRLLDAAEETQAVDQKLKLVLPLIPFLLDYELELRVDTLPALQQVWQRLRAKIGR